MAQPPDGCTPNSLNIPGSPYPCVHPDRGVTFRVTAPDAKKVQVRLGGAHDMTRGEDGAWTVTIPPQVIGFPRWLWPPPPPGAPPRFGLQGFTGAAFTEMMLTDLIPMIKRTYRVLPGRDNRAMAGLSMGGMQTFLTTLANLDKFAYIGGFSGSTGGRGGFDAKTSNNGVFADAAAFNKKVKVLFLGIGSMEGPGTKNFSEALTKAGIRNIYFESPGTAHEWLTWRRCLNDFAPRLFR